MESITPKRGNINQPRNERCRYNFTLRAKPSRIDSSFLNDSRRFMVGEKETHWD